MVAYTSDFNFRQNPLTTVLSALLILNRSHLGILPHWSKKPHKPVVHFYVHTTLCWLTQTVHLHGISFCGLKLFAAETIHLTIRKTLLHLLFVRLDCSEHLQSHNPHMSRMTLLLRQHYHLCTSFHS